MDSPPRIIEPELLDHLPADDPDAIRSRRDLRMVNSLMGNQRWIARHVSKLAISGDGDRLDAWELGAGDGTLGARIARRCGEEHLQISALDFAPRSPHWPASWDWHREDILETAARAPRTDLVIANLILHHFDDRELALVGRWVSQARTVIAVEPLRARFPHLLAYAMRLAGINYVTRKDIHTSIRAGFRRAELPRLLGLDPAGWDIGVSSTPLGAYRLFAQRRAAK